MHRRGRWPDRLADNVHVEGTGPHGGPVLSCGVCGRRESLDPDDLHWVEQLNRFVLEHRLCGTDEMAGKAAA